MAFLCAGSAQAQPAAQFYAPWQEDEARSTNNVAPVTAPFETTTIEEEEPPPSAIESAYEKRLDDVVEQFGYDIFNVQRDALRQGSPMGAVQDNFVLGSGDTLQITFTGQRNDRNTYKIDPHGVITIKDFPPISAAGRTIEDLRNTINAQLSNLHNTQAYVSLSDVRQISVLVVGHVERPGLKNLNAFHTALDALIQSGGVEKDGSLRQIKIVRNGHSKVIDLYSLLMHGAPRIDIRLRDGDRIIIPPIGPTVAVAGNVKRAGIYEIRPMRGTRTGEKISLNKILDFAGGAIRQGENRFIHLKLNSSGQEITEDISNAKNVSFSDGSILKVLQETEQRKNTIELVGHTRAPGLYDFSKNGSLSTLLGRDQRVADDLYPLLGVIERWNPAQLTTQYLSFPVRSVFKKSFDLQLQKNDKVILFSNSDIKGFIDVEKIETEAPVNKTKNPDDKNILEDDKALSSFLKEHSAHLRGSVRAPGSYPVASGVTLDNILAVAGGFTLDANRENVEIISRNFGGSPYAQKESGTRRLTFNLNKVNAREIYISPGDAIRVNQKPKQRADKTVLVMGEVKHPGKYDLLAGDKLSHLIARAGGLTDQAYPEGAIFSREAERRNEELRFRAAARDMQNRLASAVQKEKDSPNAKQIALVQDLAHELAHAEPVGRITVEADPSMLVTQPELDMLLEGGDRLYIPKRPLTVRVSGEVLSPASLQFRDAKDPIDYIKEAGGFTRSADKKRAFVLYPDGSAQPLKVSNWNHTPIFIPPGSTIIVPHDPKPFDFMEGAKDVGQILSNLAITAVFIDDIRD